MTQFWSMIYKCQGEEAVVLKYIYIYFLFIYIYISPESAGGKCGSLSLAPFPMTPAWNPDSNV